jgi:hypothetical protein
MSLILPVILPLACLATQSQDRMTASQRDEQASSMYNRRYLETWEMLMKDAPNETACIYVAKV